jgi:anti-anti-sigma factor
LETCVNEPSLSIRVVPDGCSLTLYLAGEVDLATVGTLRACLDDIDGGFRSVVLDLAEVTFLDSSGLGTLAQAARGLEPGTRTLLLRGPRSNVQHVLEMSGITRLLPIVPSAADAPESGDATEPWH